MQKNGASQAQIEEKFLASEEKRITVITKYGHARSYQIDGLTYQKNVNNVKFKTKEGVEITMLEYFKSSHKIDLKP